MVDKREKSDANESDRKCVKAWRGIPTPRCAWLDILLTFWCYRLEFDFEALLLFKQHKIQHLDFLVWKKRQ